MIFLIGIIIKQGLGFAYFQNNNLRATRMALKMSHEYSEGLKTGSCTGSRCREGISSRNSASVLLIEDRLTAESAKYGAIDRTPQIAMGSGLHTRNLFQEFDRGESWNVPIVDFFINGQHFPFTTAKLKTICLTGDKSSCVGGYDEWYGDKPNYNGVSNWEPKCAKHGSNFYGCMRFYRVSANHPENINLSYWCDTDNGLDGNLVICPVSCDPVPAPGCNLPVEKRFDLERDGRVLTPTETDDVPVLERTDFSWQWFMVMAFREEYLDGKEVKYPKADINGAEGIILHDLRTKNTRLDVDSDLKEETIISLYPVTKRGSIEGIQVLDDQEGDLDFTLNDQDFAAGKPVAGLTDETQMYTFVRGPSHASGCNPTCDPARDPTCNQKCGTYLLIEEGKLLNPDTRQMVRSTQKKDQIDIITRVIQLSNDTDRFCDAGSAPTATVDGYPNPVEVCCNKNGDCYDQNHVDHGSNCVDTMNMSKTCMFEGNPDYVDPGTRNPKPLYPKIYVRTKVVDLHGRRWVTDVSEDPKPFGH